MTDTARVLATAAALSVATAAVFAVRLRRLEPNDPNRVVGELRLAQWVAILIAALGGAPIGLSAAGSELALAHLDATIGIAAIIFAGILLHLEPPRALRVASVGFIVHALVAAAHRPGWLSPDVAPLWFTAGQAACDVCMAAICFWAARS